jgi:hypothetical protein
MPIFAVGLAAPAVVPLHLTVTLVENPLSYAYDTSSLVLSSHLRVRNMAQSCFDGDIFQLMCYCDSLTPVDFIAKVLDNA